MSVTIPSHLSDDERMAAVARLAGDERVVTARLIAHLAEIDARELYVPETGHPALCGGSQAGEGAAPAPRTTVIARHPIVAPLAPERCGQRPATS